MSDEAGRARFRFIQHGDRGTDLAGRAVAALKAIVLDESSLHGMQIISFGESLDGGDLVAIVHDSKTEAGVHSRAVNENGTSATLAMIAALLGSGQAEPLAEKVKNGSSRIDLQVMFLAVDC